EGISTTVTVASFTDDNVNAPASDFRATIDWGDGHSTSGLIAALGGGHFTVSGANTYAEEGQYTINVSISDVGGSAASVSSPVTVADAVLTVPARRSTDLEGISTSVAVASFTDDNVNAPASDFRATIDW